MDLGHGRTFQQLTKVLYSKVGHYSSAEGRGGNKKKVDLLLVTAHGFKKT